MVSVDLIVAPTCLQMSLLQIYVGSYMSNSWDHLTSLVINHKLAPSACVIPTTRSNKGSSSLMSLLRLVASKLGQQNQSVARSVNDAGQHAVILLVTFTTHIWAGHQCPGCHTPPIMEWSCTHWQL